MGGNSNSNINALVIKVQISNLALERSGAVVARKRFKSCVFAAVSDEI